MKRFQPTSFEAVEGALRNALNAHVTKLFEVLMMSEDEAGYDRFKRGLRKTVAWYERISDDIAKLKEK